jgi:hypothetical protein
MPRGGDHGARLEYCLPWRVNHHAVGIGDHGRERVGVRDKETFRRLSWSCKEGMVTCAEISSGKRTRKK